MYTTHIAERKRHIAPALSIPGHFFMSAFLLLDAPAQVLLPEIQQNL